MSPTECPAPDANVAAASAPAASSEGAPTAGSTGADGGRQPRRRTRGRPRLRPDQGELVGVLFKVSAAERDRLKTLAAATGLSVSEFLRRRAFGGQVMAAAEAIVSSEVRVALRKIGANVNQLARRANEAAQLVPAERGAVVAAMVEEADAVIVELKEVANAIKTTSRLAGRRSASPGRPLAVASGGAGDADVSREHRPVRPPGETTGGAEDGGPTRALTYSRGSASEAGLDLGGYEGEAVPEGSWVGRLDFKVWTKTGMGVSCYFTREDEVRGGARAEVPERTSNGLREVEPSEATEGSAARAREEVSDEASTGTRGGAPERYRLAAFRASGGGSRYTPRDGALDFSDDTVAPGERFVVTVGRTKKGRVTWLAARPVGAFLEGLS